MATRTFPNKHDRRCSEPGCDFKIHARGVCQTHYNRHYHAKHGNAPSVRHEGLVRGLPRGWGSL